MVTASLQIAPSALSCPNKLWGEYAVALSGRAVWVGGGGSWGKSRARSVVLAAKSAAGVLRLGFQWVSCIELGAVARRASNGVRQAVAAAGFSGSRRLIANLTGGRLADRGGAAARAGRAGAGGRPPFRARPSLTTVARGGPGSHEKSGRTGAAPTCSIHPNRQTSRRVTGSGCGHRRSTISVAADGGPLARRNRVGDDDRLMTLAGRGARVERSDGGYAGGHPHVNAGV
jgi:hypothetical protein